jgi:hypothetical protein
MNVAIASSALLASSTMLVLLLLITKQVDIVKSLK